MRGGMLPHIVMHKLSEKPLSGYGLCKAIEEATGHRPSCGSIYPLLEKFSNEGLLNVKEEGRKKVYSLTKKGVLKHEEMDAQRKELVDETVSRVRALFDLIGQESGQMVSILERLKDGTPPLGPVTCKMVKLRETLSEMVESGKIEHNKKEINAMIDKMQKRLERMK